MKMNAGKSGFTPSDDITCLPDYRDLFLLWPDWVKRHHADIFSLAIITLEFLAWTSGMYPQRHGERLIKLFSSELRLTLPPESLAGQTGRTEFFICMHNQEHDKNYINRKVSQSISECNRIFLGIKETFDLRYQFISGYTKKNFDRVFESIFYGNN